MKLRACIGCGADITALGIRHKFCNACGTPASVNKRYRARKKADRPTKIKFCESCGADISHKNAKAKFCSKSCNTKFHNQKRSTMEKSRRLERKCLECGNNIGHRGPRAIYCSDKCANAKHERKKKDLRPPPPQKHCQECDVRIPNPGGNPLWCNECRPAKMNERQRSYNARNPERAKERRHRWIQKNPDKAKESARKYARKPSTRRRAKENELARFLRDPVGFRHKQSEINHRRRSRKAGVPSGPKPSLVELVEMQGGMCANCKSKGDKVVWHMDHIIPISKGGHDTANNVQALCAYCNQSKGAKMPNEWARENGRLFWV